MSYSSNSNQQQQQQQGGGYRRRPSTTYKGPRQPYKYCRNECGRFICYSEDHKTPSGGWIPVDYETMQDHECPRNERSPNYNADMGPIPESLAIRPAVREDKATMQKKENPMVPPITGVTSDQINSILVELHGLRKTLEERVIDTQRDHSKLLELIANVLKPGPEPILAEINRRYDNSVKAMTTTTTTSETVGVTTEPPLEDEEGRQQNLTEGMRNA